MNKTVIGAAVVVAAVGGYLIWANQADDTVVVEVPVPAAEPDTTAAQVQDDAEEAAAEARAAAEEAAARLEAEAAAAAEATRDAAGQAADRLREETAQATEAARDLAGRASDSANDLAGRAAEAADGALTSTMQAATEAANSAADRLESLTQDMTADQNAPAQNDTVLPDVNDQDPSTAAQVDPAPSDAAVAADLAAGTDLTATEVQEVLTVEGFDYDRAVTVINASDMTEAGKMLSRTALDGARNSPTLLAPALEQLRNALGFEG